VKWASVTTQGSERIILLNASVTKGKILQLVMGPYGREMSLRYNKRLVACFSGPLNFKIGTRKTVSINPHFHP
jgi:hypothetical protein